MKWSLCEAVAYSSGYRRSMLKVRCGCLHERMMQSLCDVKCSGAGLKGLPATPNFIYAPCRSCLVQDWSDLGAGNLTASAVTCRKIEFMAESLMLGCCGKMSGIEGLYTGSKVQLAAALWHVAS